MKLIIVLVLITVFAEVNAEEEECGCHKSGKKTRLGCSQFVGYGEIYTEYYRKLNKDPPFRSVGTSACSALEETLDVMFPRIPKPYTPKDYEMIDNLNPDLECDRVRGWGTTVYSGHRWLGETQICIRPSKAKKVKRETTSPPECGLSVKIVTLMKTQHFINYISEGEHRRPPCTIFRHALLNYFPDRGTVENGEKKFERSDFEMLFAMNPHIDCPDGVDRHEDKETWIDIRGDSQICVQSRHDFTVQKEKIINCALTTRPDILLPHLKWNSVNITLSACELFSAILQKYYSHLPRCTSEMCDFGEPPHNEFPPSAYLMIGNLNPHMESCPVGYLNGNKNSPPTIYGADTQLCASDQSKFNDKEVQEQTTMEKFKDDYFKLSEQQSDQFNQQLYDALVKVVNNQQSSRAKRNVHEEDEDEEKLVNELVKESNIGAIRAVTSLNDNFKTLDDEFNERRGDVCAELAEAGRQTPYGQCVCNTDKQNKPLVYCQAIAKKNELEAKKKKTESRIKRAWSTKDGVDKFLKLMQAAGCTDAENCGVDNFCFEKESCNPIAAFPVLSFCFSGGACVPRPQIIAGNAGKLTVSQFTDTKIYGKVGVCITDFIDLLSFIGLEKCLAAAQLEYYFFTNQLEASGYLALVVVKVTGNVKMQIAKPFSKGFGNGIALSAIPGGDSVEDICTHDDHKCEDYCTYKPGSIGYGYKVELWFFGWNEVASGDDKYCAP